MIYLSRGGKDAHVIREYNIKTKSFVKNGFIIPEAKSSAEWIDENSLYVGTDFGPGSLTDSGYAREIKVLRRGQDLKVAKKVFEVNQKDMSAHAYVDFNNNKTYHFYDRTISFYENENWYVKDGKEFKFPMPTSSKFTGVFKEYLLFELRVELKTPLKIFKAGSLVALPLKSVVDGESDLKKLELIFEPTDKKFLDYVTNTKNYLLMGILDNIKGKIVKVSLQEPGRWKHESLELGTNGVVSIASSENEHDNFLASYTDFTTPTSLYFANAQNTKIKFNKIKTAPERFHSKDLVTEQKISTSKDGTKIPYFIIHKKNMGYGANQKTCYTHALKLGADFVIMLHPDGQYDPKDINKFVVKLKQGYDLVLGSRFLAGGDRKTPLYKSFSIRMITLLFNLVLGSRLTEANTGYRGFSRQLLETVPWQKNGNSYIFDPQMIIQTHHFGFQIAEVPIVKDYHSAMSSPGFIKSIHHGLENLQLLVEYLLHQLRLKSADFLVKP